MRYALCFILIASVVWGQEANREPKPGDFFYSDSAKTWMWVGIDGTYHPFEDYYIRTPKPSFKGKLVELLTDYEQECYADSSLECFLKYKSYFSNKVLYTPCTNINMFDPGFDPNYIGKVEIWTHREPTFKGFIKYLKEK